jgi:hypothetical protein
MRCALLPAIAGSSLLRLAAVLPNLHLGLLRRLLNDQIRTVHRTNIMQARRFSEFPEAAINRYTNPSLTTAEIISEPVKLAKEMGNQSNRHKRSLASQKLRQPSTTP